MKRLFFVRHGETHTNVAGIIDGHSKTSLTDNGKEQVKNAGKHLKNAMPYIDLIISSPLERTLETAKHIAEEIGYPIENIKINKLLIERSYGILEGTSRDEFFETHKYSDMDNVKDVETLADLQIRATRALEYVRSLSNYNNILVVSHGSFGKAFRRAVKNLPHTHEYEFPGTISNAEILELI
jgi:probable phosphoglycerate mutase